MRLEGYSEQLKHLAELALVRGRERLDNYAMLVENFAPSRLLKLGFAVARAEGKVIRTTTDVTIGQSITIEVADGTLTAKIVDKNGQES
jgi:exonuclease VII large subunit